MNPPTHAGDLVTAVVTVGIRFERPAAEVNSARTERPRRVVEVVSDIEGCRFLQPTTTRPPTTLELDGWLADGLDPPTFNLLLLSRLLPLGSARRRGFVRRSHHGPYID